MTKEDLKKYIEEHWDVDQHEVDKALQGINNDRCPLYMANPYLEKRINELVGDFLCDNLLEDVWFNEQYDDIEELFWDLDFLNK